MTYKYVFLGIPTYPFNPNSRGLCVILCNSSFKNGTTRLGADVDVQTLVATFSKLNFIVKIEENKSRSQMDMIIRNCGNEKDVSCFVCFISSHGSLEAVAGNDGELLTFKEMRSAINDNPENFLKKIPKIFFIQACQGENYLKIYKDSIDTKSLGELDSKPESLEASVLPMDADYCFSVATTPDHIACRTIIGTVYFQTLCRIINNLLETNEQISLMNILFRLNGEMGNWISTNASKLAVDPNRLKASICNIAYCTLSGDVYFQRR
ncbi:caspase-7-like isoform X1 [Hydra vulgaris]|uniref:Caspase-7-like isoform X1 n=1 Tax=Hydra vulgaris TaxID=6087 RepID=A0ABM4B3X3_HYDVU